MESLRKIAQEELDEAHTWLLLNFVETYLRLTPEEQRQYQELLAKEEYKEARNMLTYQDELILGTKRKVLLQILQEKFGSIPETAQRRIGSIESEQEMDRLLTGLIKARSLEELELEWFAHDARAMEPTYQDELILGTKRKVLLQLLQEKFGSIPEMAQRRIESIESEQEMDRLLTSLIKARSLAELGLE